MSNDFKPGDVARVNGSVAVRTDDNLSWWTTSGRLSDRNVAYIHRLVVIDPEDREQVERLLMSYVDEYGNGEVYEPKGRHHLTAAMQAALREFAAPAPVKPPEPTGLGAVVVDAAGHEWVNLRDHSISEHRRPWMAVRDPEQWRDYADINAVTVLSEGVPS